MDAQLLDAQADAPLWREALAQLPPAMQDVYFQPQYLFMHQQDQTLQGKLFLCRQAGQVFGKAFHMQPVEQAGGRGQARTWYDIQTPYGYGGVFCTSDDPQFLARGQQAFADWCRSAAVVVEFTRFHPLLENWRWEQAGAAFFDRHTASLDLRAMSAGLPGPWDAKTRNMLRRAERDGVEVSQQSVEEEFDQFVELYLNAMRNKAADPSYFFSPGYFQRLRELVRQGCLLAATVKGRWVAAAVFLRGPWWLHFHLAASDHDHYVPGANNLLIATAARWGAAQGLRRLHLGGGNSNDPHDPLWRFKKSMSSHTHDFWLGKRIHNQEIYDQLRAAWAAQYPELVSRWGGRVLCYRYRPTA